MPIVSIEHVQLAMPAGKESEARAFYQDLLGIPEIPKPNKLAKRGGAWFERGPLKVHLGVEPKFRPARKAHPALLVDDFLSVVGEKIAEDTGSPPSLRRVLHLLYEFAPPNNGMDLTIQRVTPLAGREEQGSRH